MSQYQYPNDVHNEEENIVNEVIRGTCLSMCPEEEIQMRQKERLIHLLEKKGGFDGGNKCVKCFHRSAADTRVAQPSLLRPYPVLKQTLEYLLTEVITCKVVPQREVYFFIDDRLRSIRQDMTVQRLPAAECRQLLEPMVRFYVYFGYILCEDAARKFDEVLNRKFLFECLNLCLRCTDLLPEEVVPGIVDTMSSLTLTENKLPCDRVLMESLYILCNFNDIHSLYRYLKLPKKLKSLKSVQLSYKIAISHYLGDYVRVSRLAEDLCPLTYCAFSTYLLRTVQRRTLQVMSSAYSSRQLAVPRGVLLPVLGLSHDAELSELCRHYGLADQAHGVSFYKADFNTHALLHPPKRRLIRDEGRDLSYSNIFSYTTQL